MHFWKQEWREWIQREGECSFSTFTENNNKKYDSIISESNKTDIFLWVYIIVSTKVCIISLEDTYRILDIKDGVETTG